MVPEVSKCSVTECFYNRGSDCFAHSILVGSDMPACETFMQSNQHSQKHGQSEVGACHVSMCAHNNNMYCRACDDVEVAWSGDQAMCVTFRPR